VRELAKTSNRKENKMALSALLEKNAVSKKPAAKKNAAPAVELSDDLKDAVDAYAKAKVEEKNAKAAMELHGSKVIAAVREIQDKDGFSGNYKKSYDVAGKESKVKFVATDKFSVASDDAHLLEDVLGDKFAELIKTKYVVTLKPEVLADEKLSKELEKLMGDKFDKFFNVVKSLETADDFDAKIYGAVDADGLNDVRTFVKQNKPSLR